MDGADDGGTTSTARRVRPLRAGLVAGAVVLGLVAVVGAFVVSTAAGAWVTGGLLAALLAGGAVAAWSGRHAHTPVVDAPVSPPVAATGPGRREVDDLPAFFANPPGTPGTAVVREDEQSSRTRRGPDDGVAPGPPAPPSTSAAGVPDVEAAHRTTVRRIAVGATAAVLVVVVGAAVAATVTGDDRTGGRDGRGEGTRGEGAASSTSTPARSTPPASPSADAAPLTAAAAGDLATVSVPLGTEGLDARLAFDGIVLEPRAVGSTVTRPALGLSTDGGSGVAHLELPTWNCLSATAPADPAAADCLPGPTEYADLGTPDLRLDVEGGSFELTGDFPTYTRPNGSPPAYTGRTYAVSVSGGSTTDDRGGESPATGELSLGGATTGVRADEGLSVVRTAG